MNLLWVWKGTNARKKPQIIFYHYFVLSKLQEVFHSIHKDIGGTLGSTIGHILYDDNKCHNIVKFILELNRKECNICTTSSTESGYN